MSPEDLQCETSLLCLILEETKITEKYKGQASIVTAVKLL